MVMIPMWVQSQCVSCLFEVNPIIYIFVWEFNVLGYMFLSCVHIPESTRKILRTRYKGLF